MRESSDGRNTVFPWSDAQINSDNASGGDVVDASYAVGDAIYSGDCRGTVVTVDFTAATVGVVWDDANTELDRDPAITYPMNATYLRKAMPWET